MSAHRVSTSWKHTVWVLGAAMATAPALSLHSSALAQARHPSGPLSSVLPSGGGQALLNPSDTTILLLDHHTGLFQTVKDIGVAELRTNRRLVVGRGNRLASVGARDSKNPCPARRLASRWPLKVDRVPVGCGRDGRPAPRKGVPDEPTS